MAKSKTSLAGLAPTHPGAFLREDVLPNVEMTKIELAAALGISRAQLYAMLGETAPVTAAMALRLGKFFGIGPELWLNMQSNGSAVALCGKSAVADGRRLRLAAGTVRAAIYRDQFIPS